MKVNCLAIVIPAYKIYFFEQVLDSLKAQTNQNFNIYIGNDGSVTDFENVVKRYESYLNITYKYFNNNIGKNDLVAHWERCIDMVQDEEWIWLFSDDDLMDNNCVEMLYKAIDKHPENNLFHFNIQKINDKNQFIGHSKEFPDKLFVEDFILNKINNGLDSFVVEYVFKKTKFLEVGRFCNFDLAWSSDDALWIKLGAENGIISIAGPRVYWRISNYNISPNTIDKEIIIRKLNSQIEFANWILKFSKEKSFRIDNNELSIFLFKNNFLWLKYYIQKLSFAQSHELINKYSLAFNIQYVAYYKLYILFYKLYKSIISN